ncbi:Transposable element P transposase [Paramuricea clavata]|uniref:Transposable element P transposase n=1 Tax=Paramuricea clavata TaxID=317549 RepID=A0A6S7I235_PARCT|nr:Transposable element P transposase [Paramuricea clavata]
MLIQYTKEQVIKCINPIGHVIQYLYRIPGDIRDIFCKLTGFIILIASHVANGPPPVTQMSIAPSPRMASHITTINAEQTYDHIHCHARSQSSVNTPTKKKIRRIINKKDQQIYRLKQRINLKKPNDKSKREAIKILETMLPAKICNFVKSQIDLHANKSKKGNRYSSETKAFSLSLYHISGLAYRVISRFFSLPTKSTLLKWISRMPNCADFTGYAVETIAKKVNTMSAAGKQCIISFDEISLKTNLSYQSNTDELVGLEDYGDGSKSNFLATSAIVFMTRGIVDNWKQPLMNEACNSIIVKEKLVDIIEKVESIGLNVVAVISDIGSNFQKFVKEMGITPENPWFVHGEKKIIFPFDTPHIVKAIRKNLIKYNFYFDKKVASWQDIEALYQMDTKNPIRWCPKLTRQHISPHNFERMKVIFATQVLNHSVSAGLMMAVSGGLLPATAAGTAEFTSKVDEIFDCLNSSTFKNCKELNKPITADSNHCEFIKNTCLFIKQIRVKDPGTGKH